MMSTTTQNQSSSKQEIYLLKTCSHRYPRWYNIDFFLSSQDQEQDEDAHFRGANQHCIGS